MTAAIASVHRADFREVEVKLLDAELVVEGVDGNNRPRRFRPDRLSLKWVDGKLTRVQLTGPRVRDNGEPYLNGDRLGVSLMERTDRWSAARRGLAPDAPDWVRQLVERHAPPEPDPS